VFFNGTNLCNRITAAYFWVGKRGTANPEPDQATGIAVPDETEPNRYEITDVHVTSSVFCLLFLAIVMLCFFY